MEVTSYLLDEMKSTVLVDDGAWKKTVEDLGLEGQASLVTDEKPNPIPFLRMTARIRKTFDILCPQVEKLKDFKAEPIPPAVLEIVGLVLKEGYFEMDEMSVRYRRGYPDPVLVATQKVGNTTETFLLAQWGAEKMSLERAEHDAKKLAQEKFVAELTVAKDAAERGLANPAAYVDKSFNGGWVYEAGVSI